MHGTVVMWEIAVQIMVPPLSSPVAASVTTKIKHVARFVRQCVQSPRCQESGGAGASKENVIGSKKNTV